MNVVLIGSGNVATHIAKALNAVNVNIAQVWSYHYQNASLLANDVSATAIKELSEVDFDADVCLIAIKDDEIVNIVNQLKSFKGIIAHTSGSVNLAVLENSENFGVFYPLQTFSKNKQVDFSTIPLCLEANNEESLAVLKEIANKLSTNVLEVNSDKRKILHLAAVFACNFTNHLYALADDLLKANDLDFDIIRPLITETASKVQYALPLTVQTGPAIRHDEQTLKKHEELLNDHQELLEIYKILSNSIKKTR
ncbi:Rossmann-like and DUF2520 domain-containing protein [Pedobacter cryotolerans]|uniref:DUF2520 domain-containing protein n=1 Tax=Pedobacter cryotolerans TaxID=2571270 RepID=A0A4U1C2R6_9SPHI|nr:DUF2520 domain-containing protein [Pedobacter cryotolerans]TKB99345.1 DUF2520 domain-containing protein [Pedobacter cryotolerans]